MSDDVPPRRIVVDAETAARIEDRLANPRKPNALRALWSGCPFCNEPVDKPHKPGCRHPGIANPTRTTSAAARTTSAYRMCPDR